MKFNTYIMEDALEAIIDYRGKTPQKSESGIPTLSAKSVKNNFIDYNNCYYISQEEYNRFMVRGFPKKGDILLTTEAPLGMVAKLDRDDIAIAQRLLTLRGKNNILDNDYLLYFLQSSTGQHLLKSHETGTTVTGIKQAVFRKLEISIPNIEDQRKIATILSALDSRISINTAINENLEQQAQALFKAWFVDFEPFGGVMPDDWSECILDSMCSLIIKGITPKYNEHSAQLVINQKCVRNHQIDLSLARCHEPKKVNEKWLQYGDIVVNSTGTGTLGRAAQVLFTPNNMTVDSHVTIIRASKQEYIYYLGLWATSHEHDFEMLQTGSTGQTDLPRERLKQMQIVLPSDSILSSFSKVIKPIADIRIQKQQENQRLSALRDTLLPKLMNGEIRRIGGQDLSCLQA